MANNDSTPDQTPGASPVRTFWQQAARDSLPDPCRWDDMLLRAAWPILDQLDPSHRWLYGEEGEDSSDEVINVAVRAFDGGVAIGYALGLTQPATLLEFGHWPAEAIRRCALREWATAQGMGHSERP